MVTGRPEPMPSTKPVVKQQPLIGMTVGFMWVASIVASVSDTVSMLVPALLAWLALGGCWRRLSVTQRWQAIVLGSLGVAGLGYGAANDVDIDLVRALSQNQLIITLMAAVTLLRLLNVTGSVDEAKLPEGRSAYNRSLVGVQLFGAVVNISALVIMADRLSRTTPLSKAQALMLCRSFTMATFYSPFIGGMALALAYNPGASLGTVMLTGMPLAVFGIVFLLVMGHLGLAGDLERFPGYPAQFESLWLPALLAGGVLLLHAALPSLSILVLVIMLAPLLVVLVLLLRSGPVRTTTELTDFCTQRLPEIRGELALFLAAGVLGAGLVAVIQTLDGFLPFEQFTAIEASLVLALTVIISFAGVHPLVMVTTAATVLVPLDPDPNLLAMVFVMGWGIGCACCPLSGTNVTLQSRYHVSGWYLSRKNMGFAVLMTATAIALLNLYETL